MGKKRVAERIALGAALAGVAGYIAGILSAPSSGRKTRAQLKKSAEGGLDDVEAQLKKLQNELSDLVTEAKKRGAPLGDRAERRFGTAMDSANVAKDKLYEVVGSLKKGQTNDKDLQNALADAKRAIDHLRDFLRK